MSTNIKEKKYRVRSAKEIYNFLDSRVAGQEDAKEALSVAAFLHQARTLCAYLNKRTPMKKSNILLMGPSGCGKTLLVDTMAKFLKVGVFTINAKSLTNAGFKGDSLEEHLSYFLESSSKAELETGIIFIDEFDKICMSLESSSGEDWNTSLQYSLLKAIEGAKFNVEIGRGINSTIDTSGIMFVLGGNFAQLRANRKEPKKSIGFVEQANTEVAPATLHKELMKVGVIQEIAGRISRVAELKELTREQMKEALYVEDGILAQYEELFSFLDSDIAFDESKVDAVIDRCIKNGTGARGLQTTLDELLHDSIFDFDIESLTVSNGGE